MSKIICNLIDYVFTETILYDTPDTVVLENGVEWKNLPVKEKPTYSSDIQQADAGPIREESVTVVTKYDADTFLKAHVAHSVVLRMRTDEKTFYVGSSRFPCMTEVSGDGINDTYTFKCTSIIY